MEIQDYEILEALSDKGTAKVFRAKNLQSHTQVALKVIEIVDADTRRQAENLQACSRALQCQPHPNVCSVLDTGSGDGHVFVAYELLESRDLLDGLASGLGQSQIRHIFVGLAKAIKHLEELGIVHGDIKPANILLRANYEPVLIDLAGGLFNDGNLLVSTLTPGYCSPEAQRRNPVDARTDVYSLGVVFYRTLVGDVPWKDVAGVGRTATEEDIVPRVSEEYESLQPILDAALSYDREQRQLSLDVLNAAIDDIAQAGQTPSVVVRTDLVSSQELSYIALGTERLRATRADTSFGGKKSLLYKAIALLGPLVLVFAGWLGYVERTLVQEFFSGLGIVEHPEFEQRWRTAQALRSDANQTLSAITAAYNRVLEVAPDHQGTKQAIEDVRSEWKVQIDDYIAANAMSLAQARLNELVRVYPNDEAIDGYVRSLNRMRRADRLLDDTRILQEQSGTDDSSAFKAMILAFKEIVRQFPGSPQSEEALSRLNSMSERLARLSLIAIEQQNLTRAQELLDLAMDASTATADVESAQEELMQAQSLQEEIETNLQNAGLRRNEQKLLMPPDDNAYSLFRKVLALDPDNQVALDGLDEVEAQINLKVIDLVYERNFEEVDRLVDAARSQGVSQDLIDEMEAIRASELMRIAQAEELFDEASRLFDLGYITMPESANALQQLELAQQQDPKNQQVKNLLRLCAERLAAVALDAYEAGVIDAALEYLDAALATGIARPEWKDWRSEWSSQGNQLIPENATLGTGPESTSAERLGGE